MNKSKALESLNKTFGEKKREYAPEDFLFEIAKIIKSNQVEIIKLVNSVKSELEERNKVSPADIQELKEISTLTSRLLTLQEETKIAIEKRKIEKIEVERVLPSQKVDVNLIRPKGEKDEIQSWWTKFLPSIIKAPINELIQEIRDSREPAGAIAVRLVTADGERFYNAISTAVAGGVNTSDLAKEATLQSILNALAASALADDEANPTVPRFGAHIMGMSADGATNWDRARLAKVHDVDPTGTTEYATGVSPRTDYGLELAKGNIPGHVAINQFGRAPAGVQTTASDIWSRCNSTPTQQIWVAPTTARTHNIVSTSTNDDGSPVGTGARTIRIWGLTSWSTAEVSEDITMDGTSNVATANSYVIIHRMKVLTSGSANINVGLITATAVTDGTVTAQIDIGQGQAQMAIYGVPSIQTFYLKSFYVYMNDALAATRIDAQLRLNENPNVQLTNFINKFDIQLYNSGLSGINHTYDMPPKFSGPCIIKVQGIASAADIDASAGFDGILVTN